MGIAYSTSLVLWFLTATLGMNPGPDQSPPSDQTTDKKFADELSKLAILGWIPKPISDVEIARYEQLLIVSEAQAVFLHHALEDYRNECDDIFAKALPTLIEISQQAVMGLRVGRYDPVTVERYKDFLDSQGKFCRQIRSADNRMLDLVTTVLPEEQLQRFARVRMHRQRWSSSPLEREIRAARVDLSRLVESCSLSTDELSVVDPVLVAYEIAVTPLIVEFENGIRWRAFRLVQLGSRLQFKDNGEERQPAEQAEVDPEFSNGVRALTDESTRLQKQVVETNTEYVSRICSNLPTKCAQLVNQTYLRTAYPRVFPDVLDPIELFEDALKLTSGDAPLEQQVSETWKKYRQSYDLVSSQMQFESVRWEEQFALSRAVGGEQEFKARMRQLRDSRWDLSASFLTELNQLLPQEFRSQIENKSKSLDALFANVRNRSRNDSYPML